MTHPLAGLCQRACPVPSLLGSSHTRQCCPKVSSRPQRSQAGPQETSGTEGNVVLFISASLHLPSPRGFMIITRILWKQSTDLL